MKNFRKYNEQYLQMIMADYPVYGQDYERMKEKVAGSDAQYAGAPVPFLYMPRFFTREDINAFKEHVGILSGIFHKLIQAYIKDQELREFYEFPKEIEELILLDNPLSTPFPMARFDLFYHSPKRFKLCEINTDGTSAMIEDHFLAKFFKETDAYAAFSQDHVMKDFELFSSWAETFLKLYQEVRPGEVPVVLITDIYETLNPEFEFFKKAFEEQGMQTLIADARTLEFKEGYLYAENKRIDAVYRRLVTRDLGLNLQELKPLVEAIKAGNTLFIGPIRSQIIHHKMAFAALHDSRFHHYFSSSEIKYIVDHVPYTAPWSEELFTDERFISEKNHYILKPVDYYASKGVVAGKECSEEEWQAHLKNALGKGFLIQEYVALPVLPMIDFDGGGIEDFGQITGLFVYGEEFKGIYSRAGRHAIISGIHEGRTLPSFTVK